MLRHKGGFQNCGPFLGPWYSTAPSIKGPKRDHNFDNHPRLKYSPPSFWRNLCTRVFCAPQRPFGMMFTGSRGRIGERHIEASEVPEVVLDK